MSTPRSRCIHIIEAFHERLYDAVTLSVGSAGPGRGLLDEEIVAMTKPAVRELVQMARQAGYHVVGAEQLRSNRWLLILTNDTGNQIGLLVQARPLINSADVQDLADVVRLRQLDGGILLAYGGNFSPAAQRTHLELADSRLWLCTTLPPAPKPEPVESQHVGAAVKSIP